MIKSVSAFNQRMGVIPSSNNMSCFLLYGYLNGLYFVQVNSRLIQSKLRSHYVYYGSTTCKVPTSLFFSFVAADDRVNIYLCQMFI